MQRDVSLVRLLAGCALLLGVAAWGARSSAMPGATRDAVAASGTARDPPFTFTARRIGPSMRARMTGSSWRPGCPVALSDLRLLRIGYWGFDRRAHVGRMIVAASAVDPVRRAFEELFGERFPDPADAPDRRLRRQRPRVDRGRQHLRVQLPEGHGFVALLRARVRPLPSTSTRSRTRTSIPTGPPSTGRRAPTWTAHGTGAAWPTAAASSRGRSPASGGPGEASGSRRRRPTSSTSPRRAVSGRYGVAVSSVSSVSSAGASAPAAASTRRSALESART